MTYDESFWARMAQKALQGFDASIANDPKLSKRIPTPMVRQMFEIAYMQGAQTALKIAREVDGEITEE